eukprot:1896597-Lingulodinium_polyedra.AAC.1
MLGAGWRGLAFARHQREHGPGEWVDVAHFFVSKLPCPGWAAAGQGPGAGVAVRDVAVGVGRACLNHEGMVARFPRLPVKLRTDCPCSPV